MVSSNQPDLVEQNVPLESDRASPVQTFEFHSDFNPDEIHLQPISCPFIKENEHFQRGPAEHSELPPQHS